MSIDHVDELQPLLWGQDLVVPLQSLGRAEHRRQGCPEVMRHRRYEITLDAVELFHLDDRSSLINEKMRELAEVDLFLDGIDEECQRECPYQCRYDIRVDGSLPERVG